MAQTLALNEDQSNSGWRSGRKIERVPEVLLREERNRHDYIPKVVSFGPYHHGNPELRFTESFKALALKYFLEAAGQQEDMCLQEIKKEIAEIRNCYELEGSTVKYTDDELAQMMLLDASFIAALIATKTDLLDRNLDVNPFYMNERLGDVGVSVALRDMCLVDNQIPFWIVKLFLSIYTPEDEEEVLDRYLTKALFGDLYSAKRNPSYDDGDALHLLEHLYRALADDTYENIYEPEEETRSSHVNCCFSVKEGTNTDLKFGECCRSVSILGSCLKKLRARVCKCRLFKKAKGNLKILGHSFRSLTELRAKGIHFRPSPTQSLRDVKFKSSFMYAELQLPTLSADLDIKTLFLNMICHELDPHILVVGVVVSYINLMKSLIVKPEDVKELREKKILLGLQGSDEEIVKMFQDLNTYGADNPTIYGKEKDLIQEHCDSKAKTWMAELIHTYFRSPWTFITLLVTICLLVLTILQTVYTM